jgi:DNA gyrase subunit A
MCPEVLTVLLLLLLLQAGLVEKVAQLVEGKVLEGVSDVRDESDRSGVRVVVEVKRGWSPDLVMAQLMKHTRLEMRFSCNMVRGWGWHGGW